MCILCKREAEYQNDYEAVVASFEGVETLDISFCKTVTYIPEIPGLKKIVCAYCTSLVAIPAIQSLEYVSCNNCTSLVEFPSIVCIEYISCSYCTSLVTLPKNLPFLQELICMFCYKLERIPTSRSMEELWCNNCTSLLEIPNNQNLTVLSCDECSNLHTIPHIYSLKHIWCRFCPNLCFLPKIAHLKEIRCDRELESRYFPEHKDLVAVNATTHPSSCFGCGVHMAVVLSTNCGHLCLCVACSNNGKNKKCPRCDGDWTNLVKVTV